MIVFQSEPGSFFLFYCNVTEILLRNEFIIKIFVYFYEIYEGCPVNIQPF